MKYHRKITVAVMMLVIAAFFFSNRHYFFNKQNDFGGSVFTMTTLKIWNEMSPADYNFCQVLTHNNSGDKYIAYYKRLEDKKGNNYFVSQPPFAPIFAYFFFKIFQLPFNSDSIILLSFLLHLSGSILVYFIVNVITGKKLFEFSLSALTGMIVFLFIPTNIYSYASHYIPEFIFLLSGILFFLLIVKKRSNKILHYMLLGLSVFLASYTDWIGLFFGFSVILYCVFRIRDKLFLKITVCVSAFTFCSLLLTFIQYSSLNGTGEMIHAMTIRFLGRSGLFGSKYSELGINLYSISSWIVFFKKLNLAFVGFGYLMLVLIAFFLLLKKKIQYQKGIFNLVFCAVILPVIIHYIIFFNSNAIHQYYISKMAVPVSILTGVLFNFLNQTHLFGYRKAFFLLLVFGNAILSHFILLSNYPLVADYSVPKKQAVLINKKAMPEEAVFISRDTTSEFFADYYLSYLSDRNLMYADNTIDAVYIAKKHNKTKGVYFKLNRDTALCEISHFIVTDYGTPK